MPRRTSTTYHSPADEMPKEDFNKTKDELRQEALDGVLQLAQFGCLAFGQFADAGAIGVHGPPMMAEVVKLADKNSKVASKVDLLIEVGPYAGIVAAAIPFLAQLFVNHGMFKAEQFANAGVVTPDELEMKIKTQMMQAQIAAKQEQMRVEEELRAMAEEMEKQMNGDGEKDNDE